MQHRQLLNCCTKKIFR